MRLTPWLLEAIQLLSLPKMELMGLVQRKMEDNPFLEGGIDTSMELEAPIECDLLVQRVDGICRAMVNRDGIPRVRTTPQPLAPVTRRQVAEELRVHESTVGRVVSGKLVFAHGRSFPLGDFFGNGLRRQDMLRVLQALVEAKEPSLAYTDEQLAILLQERGYRVARRTVSSYRRKLGIPSASQRGLAARPCTHSLTHSLSQSLVSKVDRLLARRLFPRRRGDRRPCFHTLPAVPGCLKHQSRWARWLLPTTL